MNIAAVETTIVKLPFTHGGQPTGFGGRAWGTIDILLVEIRTEDGLSGWGEAFGFNISPATKVVLDRMVTPLLIGADSREIDAVCNRIARDLHLFGRIGPVTYALSGINIALWDLKGKREGLPLWRLLGGAGGEAPATAAYASLLRYATPDDVARNVRRALADGYQAIKLHEIDPACVRAAREAAGPGIPLMVDVNCAWSPAEACAAASQMRDAALTWLEEPVWPPEDFAGLAGLRDTGIVPVAAGENAGSATDFRNMIACRAVDYVQPSVIKCGGVSELAAILTLAGDAGVKAAPHSPYFGPGFLATLHVFAARGGGMLFERLYVDLPDNLYGDAIHPVQGRLTLPDGPGLGRDPDPAVIVRFRDTPVTVSETH